MGSPAINCRAAISPCIFFPKLVVFLPARSSLSVSPVVISSTPGSIIFKLLTNIGAATASAAKGTTEAASAKGPNTASATSRIWFVKSSKAFPNLLKLFVVAPDARKTLAYLSSACSKTSFATAC